MKQNETKEWLKSKNNNSLIWQAISPDLNTIEKVCSTSIRKCLPIESKFEPSKSQKKSHL
jgi:hypothetical protein